jgi:hypothetical protein
MGAHSPLRKLSPHQNATVTAISEMIIPRTETQGAADAGVPAFIDLILTDWYTDEQRSDFLNGLADVDARTQDLFNKDFTGCSAAQRAEILTEFGTKMIRDVELMNTQRENAGNLKPRDNFYYMVHSLTLTGYYTSEVGATTELNYEIIPNRYDPCADLEADMGAAANR